MSEKKVLIIGYGVAGSQVAASLAKTKKYAVTVLNPFDYMEVSVNMSKNFAAGVNEHAKSATPLIPEDGVQYITGTCESLTNTTATTSTGEAINFDVCVCNTGQQFPLYMPDPRKEKTLEERKATVADTHDKIVKAKTIVVSGGGPVGCETAGDIKLRFKDKKVILVVSQASVLNTMNWGLPVIATQTLKDMGVEVLLNERVKEYQDGKVLLKSDRSQQCDLYLPCHSIGGNCMFLPESARTPTNFAKVNGTFAVETLSNVFAIGDCSNYDPVKTFLKIEDQLPTLLKNVMAVLDTKGKASLVTHKKGMMGDINWPLLVALGHGQKGGVGVGPDLGAGAIGTMLYLCCCFGMPCSAPAGAYSNKMKSDFNDTVTPKKGMGIHR